MGKTYECGVSLEKAQLLEPGLDVRLTVGGEGLGRHDLAAVDDAAAAHSQNVVHSLFLGDLRALLNFGVSGVCMMPVNSTTSLPKVCSRPVTSS